MHRLACATVAAALAVATLGAGCTAAGARHGNATGSPVRVASAPPAAGSTGHASGRGAPAKPSIGAGRVRHAAQGPIIRPECASRGVPVDGLLRAMRTGHHARFDRVVFEFCGSRVPPHRIAYVDEVRRDPSDRALPLHGRAFLSVVVQGGTANTAPIATDPAAAPRYRGPDRLTPRHPLVADVAIAGDFERVLSFGIGVRRPAGLHVTVLSEPPRLVVDFWATPPGTLVWPARTLAEARRLQIAAFEGHQPWWLPGTPQSMATAYAQRVLNWPQPELRRITATVYQVRRPGTDDRAVLTLTQPVCPGNPRGLWNVADVAR
ncbi:MAG TPA: hypothetical protein VGQ92_28515 [Actinoplanes sp.]|nr:hypothetical protein [Actinoplanes sp.]